jgi:hypothetical protein
VIFIWMIDCTFAKFSVSRAPLKSTKYCNII